MKRILSILICVAMLISLLGVFPAYADNTPNVVSIEVEDFTIYEKTNGYFIDDGHGNLRWHYSPHVPYIKVTLSDDSVIDGDPVVIAQELDTTFCITAANSDAWTVGNTYQVSAWFDNVSPIVAKFNVTIEPSPVAYFEISGDFNSVENLGGCMAGYRDELGNYIPDAYFRYTAAPEELCIFYKDETSETVSFYELVERYGYQNVFCSDEQSVDNQWGVGIHNVTINVLGCIQVFPFEVLECPVESIFVPDFEVIENVHGFWDYDPDNANATFWRYSTSPQEIVITMKDGTVYSGNSFDIFQQTGIYPGFIDDQTYQTPWEVGTHTVSIEFMGFTSSFNVVVLANPIVSITVDPVTVIENCDGWYTDYPDKNNYFYYSSTPNTVTVELANGSIISGEYYEVFGTICEKYPGTWPDYYDDQSYENQWGIGTHTATLSCMGKQFDYEVNIVKSPVKSVSVSSITLYKDLDGYYDDENNFHYSLPQNIDFTVTLDDGTILKPNEYGTVKYNDRYYSLFFDEFDDSEWSASEPQIISAVLMGVHVQVTVNISDVAYKELEISGKENLIITLTKSDGTKESFKAEKVMAYGGSNYSIIGQLITDKHIFTNVVFSYDNKLPYMQDLYMQIQNLESNIISTCSWLRANMCLYSLAHNLISQRNNEHIISINGAVDKNDIDTLVEMSEYCGQGYESDFAYIDGRNYYVVTADTSRNLIRQVFGYENIDVTAYSGYNKDDGLLYIPENAFGYGFDIDISYEYTGGKWVMTAKDSNQLSLKVVLNDNVQIEEIYFSSKKTSFKDVIPGAYYEDAVSWAVDNNVTLGTSDTTFSPDKNCTRAQVVTFLWRAAGCPKPTITTHKFTDVKNSDFYYTAMLWAVGEGITNGTSETKFSPNATCTRGQIVTFQWRAKGQPSPKNTTHKFKDVKQGEYYYNAMLWAIENNITNGTSNTTFSPNTTCTRAQVVTFLYRDLKPIYLQELQY